MQSVLFGGEKHERLEIAVHGCERGATSDHHNDNWLSVEVSIRSGAFQGGFRAAFLTGELEAFHSQLVLLHQTLRGNAEFRTLEEQLTLTLTGDGRGHMQLSGEALDQAGIGNRLIFGILLDQTQLQSSVQSLAAVLAAYPVRT